VTFDDHSPPSSPTIHSTTPNRFSQILNQPKTWRLLRFTKPPLRPMSP
jgi:hypothetical protein